MSALTTRYHEYLDDYCCTDDNGPLLTFMEWLGVVANNPRMGALSEEARSLVAFAR